MLSSTGVRIGRYKSTLKRVGMWQHHCCPNVPPSKGTTNLHTRSHQATNLGHCLLTACAMIYHQGTQSVTTLKVIADNILLLIRASQPVSLSSSIAQRLGTHQGSNLTYNPRPGSLSSRWPASTIGRARSQARPMLYGR